ncbi:MAG: hypothetical protein HY078_14430 [Elusimicrobia bacterium]|nr:hypothetical protein [Elusimicrobiota bacterium]
MRRARLPLAALLLAASAPRPCAALDLEKAEAECPGSSWPWKRQGPLVNIPAIVASQPVKQTVGMALALTMVPIDLVAQAVRGKPQDDAPIPKYAHIGLCGGVLLGKGVALAVGTPFWLLEGMFWTWPRALLRKDAPPPAQTPSAPS